MHIRKSIFEPPASRRKQVRQPEDVFILFVFEILCPSPEEISTKSMDSNYVNIKVFLSSNWLKRQRRYEAETESIRIFCQLS